MPTTICFFSVCINLTDEIYAVGFGDTSSNFQFIVAKRNSDGSAENSFGSAGFANYGASGAQRARASVLQSDGKLIMAGESGGNAIGLIRITPSGVLDPTFNGGLFKEEGITDFGHGVTINGVALQSDGKILVVGSLLTGSEQDFLIARFLTSGDIDTSFHDDGFVTTDYSNGISSDSANSVAIQPDGKIVVAGSSNAGGTLDVAIARYQP